MNETHENENTGITNTETANQIQTALIPEGTTTYIPTMWNNNKLMSSSWKMAEMLAKGTFIPQAYQNNPANCLIAIDIANRMNMPPLMVLQSLYIVQGKPSWSGQFCVAAINGCGKFEPLEYVFVGEQGTPSYGCYARAVRISNGKVCVSDTVTLQMANDEGWMSKNGSKWRTMPGQMLRYRSASFFARVHCPEVLLGLQTVDEIEDVRGAEEDKPKKVFKLDKKPDEPYQAINEPAAVNKADELVKDEPEQFVINP